jgi:hypothetical protein
MNNRKQKRKENEQAIASMDSCLEHYQEDVVSKIAHEEQTKAGIRLDLTSMPIYKEGSYKTVLNHHVYDYVEDIYSYLDTKKDISIDVEYPETFTDADKATFQDIFRAHYANEYQSIRSTMKKKMIMSILFVFIGIVLISLHWLYTTDSNPNSVLGEVVDICGWVFVWEAGSSVFTNIIENQHDLRRCLTLYKSAMNEVKKAQ